MQNESAAGNNKTKTALNGDAEAQTPIWLRATPQDVDAVDFHLILNGCSAAGCSELSEIFQKAARDTAEALPDSPEVRVFSMLGAVTHALQARR